MNSTDIKQGDKVKFPTAPQYKDLWAIYAFGLGSLAFVILSIFCFVQYSLNAAVDLPFLSQGAIVGLFVTVLFVGGMTTFGYFFLLSRFAGTMIKATLVASVVMQLAIGVYFFIDVAIGSGVIFFLSGIMSGIIFWVMNRF